MKLDKAASEQSSLGAGWTRQVQPQKRHCDPEEAQPGMANNDTRR